MNLYLIIKPIKKLNIYSRMSWKLTFFCAITFINTLTNYCSFAQLKITFPMERAVFQRDTSNLGKVFIAGYSKSIYEKIEVKLISRIENNFGQSSTAWQEIHNKTDLGSFDGYVEHTGGWYSLVVRALVADSVASLDTIQRVGIGEVFMICGQSNAQGVRNYGAVGSIDDRVNAVNYFNESSSKTPPEILTISHLDQNADIGPNGKTPWCWSEVGDSLAKKLDVPILFFNSAWTGTLTYNWWQSYQEIPTLDPIFRVYFPTGFPYHNLKLSLQYYASLFGVRSVLWHQGESDVYPGVPNRLETYGYMKGLIQQSRKDFNPDLAWVISKASYVDGRRSDAILGAQQDIINEPGFNAFEGPFTDNLMIPRYDGVHFANTENVKGLSLLANAWLEKMNTEFFKKVIPVNSIPTIDFDLSCKNFIAKISAPSDYQIYKWSDGIYEDVRYGNSGIFEAIFLDNNKQYKWGVPINLDIVKFKNPHRPVAESDRFCDGDSLEINADSNYYQIEWNTGSKGNSIVVNSSGNYSYTAKNAIGCEYEADSSIKIEKLTKPIAHSIQIDIGLLDTSESYNLKVIACEGDSILISAEKDPSINSYFWSNGSQNEHVKLLKDETLSYFYTQGELNCKSEISDTLYAEFRENPPPLQIEQISPFRLAAYFVNSGDSVSWFYNNKNLMNDFRASITINKSGIYFAKRVKTATNLSCASSSSNNLDIQLADLSKIFIFPNPTSLYVNMETSEATNIESISLFDKLGHKYKDFGKIPGFSGNHTLELPDLAPGIYILEIKKSNGVERKHLFIN